MKKSDNYYFDGFVELCNYSCNIASMLFELIDTYDVTQIEDNKNKIHAIEHDADIAKHSIMKKLSKEFITVIDKEDILELLTEIDDVTDSVEEVFLHFYMYNVKTILPMAKDFVSLVKYCCESVKKLFEEFANFRKSTTIPTLITNVLKVEEQCDILYLKSVRFLYSSVMNPIDIYVWEMLCKKFEQCCDDCGHLSKLVEQLILKNS
ncbi:MAG: DUF47 family protein [Clostridia bacterium]